MTTVAQIAARLDTTDRLLIRTYLDHQQRNKAVSYVANRLNKGPVMSAAIVEEIDDV